MLTNAEVGNDLGRCWCGNDDTTGGHTHHETPKPVKRGWECPKCGAVYAPWVMECKRHRPYQMFGTWVFS